MLSGDRTNYLVLAVSGKKGSTRTIADICAEAKSVTYTHGCGYYKLAKKEKVGATKQLVACHQTSSEVVEGGDAVRDRLKLPQGDASIGPKDVPAGWDLYVNSTSANRGIPVGSQVLISTGPKAPCSPKKAVSPSKKKPAPKRVERKRGRADSEDEVPGDEDENPTLDVDEDDSIFGEDDDDDDDDEESGRRKILATFRESNKARKKAQQLFLKATVGWTEKVSNEKVEALNAARKDDSWYKPTKVNKKCKTATEFLILAHQWGVDHEIDNKVRDGDPSWPLNFRYELQGVSAAVWDANTCQLVALSIFSCWADETSFYWLDKAKCDDAHLSYIVEALSDMDVRGSKYLSISQTNYDTLEDSFSYSSGCNSAKSFLCPALNDPSIVPLIKKKLAKSSLNE